MRLPLKAICFDYYMTLVQLENPFERMKIWMKEHMSVNCGDVDFKRFQSKFTRNRAVLTAQGEFRLGIDLLTESLEKTCKDFGICSFADKFKVFADELFVSPPAYPDAHPVLDELRRYYRVGLLTNADNYILRESVARQGFAFDFIVSSEDARCSKPDKGIFLHALRALGAEAGEILMIGDSQVDDIYGAGSVSIRTLWVNRSGESLREGIREPDYEVSSLNEIVKILK